MGPRGPAPSQGAIRLTVPFLSWAPFLGLSSRSVFLLWCLILCMQLGKTLSLLAHLLLLSSRSLCTRMYHSCISSYKLECQESV